jgi:protein subunit release factor B
MEKDNTSGNQNLQQASTQWAEIIGELFDRLTGKGASVTYNFDNLEIDLPRAKGPGGQDMGSAKWTINGRVVITAEAHKTSEEQLQRADVTTAA